jgi:hypothetical protein
MSYGLRGYGFGLGDVILAPPTYENCNDYDSACVARNEVLANAYDLAASQAQAQANMNQCMANAQNATPGAQYDAVVAACNGQFAIQNSVDPVAALAQAIANPPASTGSTVTASGGTAASGGATTAGTTSTAAVGDPTTATPIPWWVWALAAGAALFMVGGGRGR